MSADLADLKHLARDALARAAASLACAIERRRAAVATLLAARPNLAAPVALRLVKQVEAEQAGLPA
ncbi:MAG: hypothetical protein RIB45_05585 [Marivibrio sp.]|uniref:hypothetical protein n=1 Tax=Marivibrio sp. TaxID=2039719 RepID=UPI0032ECDD3C